MQAQNFNPAITVNGEIITNYDLEQREKLIKLFDPNTNFSDGQISKILVDEIIQEQYAKKLGINATEIELLDSKKKLLASTGLSDKEFLRILDQNKVSVSTLDKFLSSKIIWKKVILQKFGKRSQVSYYELSKPFPEVATKITPKIDISEIVIPFSERGKSQTILLIKRLYVELSNGANFAKAAKRFSKSPTAKEGGSIGLIESRLLPRQVYDIVSKIGLGEISKPIILSNSAVLFRVNKRLNIKKSETKDYKVRFLTTSFKPQNSHALCQNELSESDKFSRLSELSSNLKLHLQRMEVYGTQPFTNDSKATKFLVLCNRILDKPIKGLVDHKDKIFKRNLTMFSEKLMIDLRRKSIISKQ